MYPDGGLVQSRQGTDLPRRAPFVMTQHEHRSLPLGELGKCPSQAFTTLTCEQLILRRGILSSDPFAEVPFSCRAVRHRRDPALAAGARFDSVQAPVDQDAGKPDFKWELFAEG